MPSQSRRALPVIGDLGTVALQPGHLQPRHGTQESSTELNMCLTSWNSFSRCFTPCDEFHEVYKPPMQWLHRQTRESMAGRGDECFYKKVGRARATGQVLCRDKENPAGEL